MVDNTSNQTQIEDFVYSLATSPSFVQDGICFAARRSGLYQSSDGGLTWRFAYESLQPDPAAPLTTTAVAISPDFETDSSVFAGVAGGILRSVDGGKTWNAALLGSPPPLVSALAISPSFAHDGTLFAATMEDGVFRSADRGGRWVAWNFGLLDLNILCLAISPDFATDETLFVGTESGMFRSTNGGRAWREVDFPTEFAPVLSIALSPGHAFGRDSDDPEGNSAALFAGTENFGLFYSENAGCTWEHLDQDRAADTVNAIILSPEFPAKPDVLAMLSDALIVSRDGGRSWSDWQADLPVERGLASVAAPQGLDPGASLLVGLVDGKVLRI